MPTPTTPLSITVISSTATFQGEKVKIINETKSQTIIATFSGDEETSINPHDTYPGWAKDDEIRVEMNGRLQGVATATLLAKGKKINLTTAAVVESASVSLSVNM